MPLYDRDYMRDSSKREPSWVSTWTPLHWIIAVNVMVFVMQHVIGVGVGAHEIPLGGVSLASLAEGRVWTAVTYMFVHEGPWHLIGNLLLIGFVGHRLQSLIGPRHFTLVYFLSGLVGAGVQMLVERMAQMEMGPGGIIGASACGSGLFLAYAAILPTERISVMLYFILPVTARLWTLAMVFMGIDAALGVSALVWPQAHHLWGNCAYFAHIGGGFLGWYFVRMLGFSGYSIDSEHIMRQRMSARRTTRRQQVARVRRERAMPEMEDAPATRRRRDEPGRHREVPVMEDVNQILEKISREGMSSLTEEERRQLDAASREIALRERRGNS